MVTRIEVSATVFDTKAHQRQKKFADLTFGKKIKSVSIVDVYTIEKELTSQQLAKVASMLANPITQKTTVILNDAKQSEESRRFLLSRTGSFAPLRSAQDDSSFTWAIEIGFLPGVTDNIATTAKEAVTDLLKSRFNQREGVYSSQITFIDGAISEKQAQEIAASLYNPLIQRASVKSYSQFKKDGGMDFIVPKVHILSKGNVTEVNLDVDDDTLAHIGKCGIANADGSRRGPLALSLEYMKTIQDYFKKLGRNPTDIELESLAQTWSEHCKHTIFRDPIDEIKDGIFKHFIKRATDEIRKQKSNNDFCVSVFTDNSGGIAFDDHWVVTHKVETHNSPSALDPFGGAVTGIVGVNRDTIGFGLGAKPIANYYGYCFANPFVDVPLYKGRNRTQKMLSSRRIMNGVIDGVNNGGNCSGIPTPQGFVYFDERFRGKPLVFVGTVGLIPRSINGKPSHVKKARPGDYIVVIGGRVGKDGIHGATFSSEAMDQGSPATAVQIGDPITQKKFSDAIVREVRDKRLYNSITDNGAGGLSCSVAEMAKESGGCKVDLEKVPCKYPGLEPWEIWVSESQERMTLAVPPKKWLMLQKLLKRHDVEATVIGTFTNSGKCIVTYRSKIIMDLDLNFLHEGLPKRVLKTKRPKRLFKEPRIPDQASYTLVLSRLLSSLNIASYDFITRQYDHIVQGNAVLMPLQGRGQVNAEVSTIRPVLTSNKALAMSQGLYPSYSDISCYDMAASAIDTAIRNLVAAGVDPNNIAILDNFCWCSANEPERLWQLKEAAKACYDYSTVYGTPFISGKDSMFNDFSGFDSRGKPIKISIPPTLLITSLGITDATTALVSLDSKNSGDLVYVIGETNNELGGSECYNLVSRNNDKILGNTVPRVNASKNKQAYEAYHRCIQDGLVASAISVTRGGLAVALAKMAMGGLLGLSIDLNKLPGNAISIHAKLFSESQGRIIVTVAEKSQKPFEKYMNGSHFACLGQVTQKPNFVIKDNNGKPVVNTSVNRLLKAYRSTFEGF